MPHIVSNTKNNSSGLNEKQQRFIEAYAQGKSPFEAACFAGYSQQNAKTTAKRLLQTPDIQAALQQACPAVTAQHEDTITNEKNSREPQQGVNTSTAPALSDPHENQESNITPEAVVRELAAIGFTSMNDVCTWSEDGVILRHSDDIPSMANAAIAEVRESGTARGGVLVKLHSKLRALEMLGRHLGMFSTQIGNSQGVQDGLAFEAAQALFDDKENPLPEAILAKLNAVYGHHAKRCYGKDLAHTNGEHLHTVTPEYTYSTPDSFDTSNYDDDDFDNENVDAGSFNTFN